MDNKNKIKFCVDRKMVVWKRNWFYWEGDEDFDTVKDEVIKEFRNDPEYFEENPGKIVWYDEEEISDPVILGWDGDATCELYMVEDWDEGDEWLPVEDNRPLSERRAEKIDTIISGDKK